MLSSLLPLLPTAYAATTGYGALSTLQYIVFWPCTHEPECPIGVTEGIMEIRDIPHFFFFQWYTDIRALGISRYLRQVL